MIIEVKEELLDEVMVFAWNFASQQETSSFPKFKDFDHLKKVFLRSFQSEEDKVLACIESEGLMGVLNLQVKKEDLYLQALGGIFAKQDFNEVAKQFIQYLKIQYPNFKMYFGYPKENIEAITFLEKSEAELIEACLTMELNKEDFVCVSPQYKVKMLSNERYEEYAAFHDYHHPNIYWNSQRIFEHLDRWNIYVAIEHEKMIGSIFIRTNQIDSEIFGISIDEAYKNQRLELDLLSVSLEDCFKKNIERLLFFVNEEDQNQIDVTLEVGFKQIDTYRCYQLKL